MLLKDRVPIRDRVPLHHPLLNNIEVRHHNQSHVGRMLIFGRVKPFAICVLYQDILGDIVPRIEIRLLRVWLGIL